jgi:hypothetical protein
MRYLRVLLLVVASAAAATLAAAPAAFAQTRATVTGELDPVRSAPGDPLDVTLRFTLDPIGGAEAATVSGVILRLPRGGRINAALFPVCSAETINAALTFRVCPRGSRIGGGTVTVDVSATGVYNVPATVTLFNGSRSGGTVTMHIRALRPVDINQAIEARIVRTRGRYGYEVHADLPENLQEIYPGWFQQTRRFTATLGATRRVRGRTRGYLEATRCPRSGAEPVAGEFIFRDGSTATAENTIRCRPER